MSTAAMGSLRTIVATHVVLAGISMLCYVRFAYGAAIPPAPWSTSVQKAYMLQVSALTTAPTQARAYIKAKAPVWTFKGGDGYLLVLKYSATPVGPYSELIYLAGKVEVPECPGKNVSTVTRIWVDSQRSRTGGRQLFGVPKDLATFKWSKVSNKREKVIVKEISTTVKGKVLPGKVFFQATFEMGAAIDLRTVFPPTWITPPTGDLISTPQVSWPLVQDPSLPGPWLVTPTYTPSFSPQPALFTAVNLKIRAEVFTGSKNNSFAVAPAAQGIFLGKGTTAVAPVPQTFTCTASTAQETVTAMSSSAGMWPITIG